MGDRFDKLGERLDDMLRSLSMHELRGDMKSLKEDIRLATVRQDRLEARCHTMIMEAVIECSKRR